MNTPSSEQKFAAKIRFALNLSSHRISPANLLRLQQARQLALSRRKAHRFPLLASLFGSGVRNLAWAAPALGLVLGLAVLSNWQAPSESADLAAIESAVLKDELPLYAYLDKGFNRYLLQGE